VEGSGILLTHMISGWDDYKWGNLSPTCMPLVSFAYEGCASFLFYKIITYQNKKKKMYAIGGLSSLNRNTRILWFVTYLHNSLILLLSCLSSVEY